jgi:hypothetical protein
MTIDCQVGEELFDFRSAHHIGMLDAVEADKALSPVDVGLLGSISELLGACQVAKLVQQFHSASLAAFAALQAR